MATTKAEAPELQEKWLAFWNTLEYGDKQSLKCAFNAGWEACADLAPAGERKETMRETFAELWRADAFPPAGELVSREAAIAECERQIDNLRAAGDRLDCLDLHEQANGLQSAVDAIAALPLVARVPDAARAAAEEIEALLVPSPDYDNLPTISAIEAVILKHCGVARVPESSAAPLAMRTRNAAERFIADYLHHAEWENEKLMVTFEEEALIAALIGDVDLVARVPVEKNKD